VEDRYRSLFVVGRGGMGAVEVALERGNAGFARIVALKRLLPEQARDPRHKEMFLREARLAALLKHPNVVHAFAFGELYGELFLAMEYVEGETLSRVLSGEKRGLDPATVAFVLAEVCDGLHAAHELRDTQGTLLNVVHRDVSPHNVMIAYAGYAKILDFGVAKFDTGGHETRTGEVKGKMAYMSPEQALGEKLDRRSDLYSVGAVLFECLTGHRMWGNGTDMEVMRRLALEEPPHLEELLPDVPPALSMLHRRLVARAPEERPDTAADVAKELRAYASSWPRPDTAAVAAMMQRQFAKDAEKRRAELNQALVNVAPSSVETLRRTLDPEQAFDQPTIAEAVILRSEPPGGSAAKKWKRGAIIIGVAAAALGTAAFLGLSRKTPEVKADQATATATAPTTAVATATATPSATTPTPTPTPTIVIGAPPPSPRPAGKPTKRPTQRPAPTPGSKPPDVDPTPF
jgi:serine/threonine-protein kinase